MVRGKRLRQCWEQQAVHVVRWALTGRSKQMLGDRSWRAF